MSRLEAGKPGPSVIRRVEWADTGRGLAIALVVLYHATNWLYSAHVHIAPWQDVTGILASLRMPLFFVLAGAFASKWLVAPWRGLLRVKVLLFAWVFLVWMTIGTLVFPLGLAAQHKPIGVTGQLKALLLSPVVPRYELWFIWALALFFVLGRATRRVPPWLQLVVAAIASAVGLTLWAELTTGPTGAVKFYFFFLAGIYGSRRILAFGNSARPGRLAGLGVLWLVVSVVLYAFHLRGVFGLYFLNCLLGVGGGIAWSRALSPIARLAWLGRRTLPIYLAHTPFVIAIIFVLSRSPFHGLVSAVPLLLPPLVAIAALLASLGLHSVAQRAGLTALYDPPRRLGRLLDSEGSGLEEPARVA
jgi:uncharacterized membrane protein YcfT